MRKFNENPVDCFNWRVTPINYIDPDKLNNISRLIEDCMNGRKGEKEKMNSYEIAVEKVRTMNSKLVMKFMLNSMYGIPYYNHTTRPVFMPEIKNVVFNPPATIVFWNDGTKTVVKCQNNEEFDPEKGITMAFFKKMHGNKGHYFEEIKKWTKKYEDEASQESKDYLNSILDASDDSAKETPDNPKWHIWYKIGMLDEIHCYEKDYSTKSSAVRRAKKLCECDDYNITIWTVSQKAPFGPESDDVEWHLN